jgi:hypothetical protein
MEAEGAKGRNSVTSIVGLAIVSMLHDCLPNLIPVRFKIFVFAVTKLFPVKEFLTKTTPRGLFSSIRTDTVFLKQMPEVIPL